VTSSHAPARPSLPRLALALALLLAPFAALAAPAGQPAAQTRTAQAAPAAPPAQPAPPVVKAKPDEVQQKLDSLKAELEQIGAGVLRAGQTDRGLTDLRVRVEDIRKAAEAIEAAETPRLQAIETRLKQLGPTPQAKDDEPPPVEADALKNERDEQLKLAAVVQARVKQSQVLLLRSDEIVKAIGDARRDRFTSQLTDRSRSLIEPALWVEAVQAMPTTLSSFRYLMGDWFGLLAARGGETAIAVGTVLLAIIGLGVVARRRLGQLAIRDSSVEAPPVLRRAAVATGIVGLNTLVPVFGLWAIAQALTTFDLNPPRVDRFLEALAQGVGAAMAIAGVGLALLAPGKPQWRLAAVSDAAAHRLQRLVTVLAVCHGVGVALTRLFDVLAAPVAEVIAFTGLFAAIDAVLGMLMLRTVARALALAGEEETIAPVADEPDPSDAAANRSSLWRWVIPFGWLAAIAALVALVSGHVALAAFVSQQFVRTAVVLGLLSILLLLADELIVATFDVKTRIGTMLVRSMGFSRETVEQIGVLLSGAVRLFLIVFGALAALAPIGLDSRDLFAEAKVAFFGFKIGGFTFSLSAILSGLVLLAIGVAMTRGIQGWLDHRFLPRTRLDVGLKNSIRTGLGYVGMVVSVMLAFSVVGLDLQNLAIVASALAVGVGFGLQSIVNNFVSGLILLAERPIKAGDLVEVGSEKGFVRKINVRSTEIETFDRASLIVPNSSLISGNVKNWMHRDLTGRCQVNVGVAYDADPHRVKEALLDVAREHSKVRTFPAPGVFFVGFGENSLDFRLVCTVGNVNDSFAVESDLRFAIVERLRALGIEIPFAQRDISIRQLNDIDGLIARLVRPDAPGGHASGSGAGLPETDA
jgi:small-conductance mechanosensitive channel